MYTRAGKLKDASVRNISDKPMTVVEKETKPPICCETVWVVTHLLCLLLILLIVVVIIAIVIAIVIVVVAILIIIVIVIVVVVGRCSVAARSLLGR